MGIIRKHHKSPGIYTRLTSLRDIYPLHMPPLSTANSTVNGEGGDIYNPIFYFGYIPIKTENGYVTEDNVEYLMSLTGDYIKGLKSIIKIVDQKSAVELTNKTDYPIHSDISVSELENLLSDSSVTYDSIADQYNSCIAILVPYYRYVNNPLFSIVEERFGVNIENTFLKISDITVEDKPYVLLCMFDNCFAYSRIGEDKIVSPLKMILRK